MGQDMVGSQDWVAAPSRWRRTSAEESPLMTSPNMTVTYWQDSQNPENWLATYSFPIGGGPEEAPVDMGFPGLGLSPDEWDEDDAENSLDGMQPWTAMMLVPGNNGQAYGNRAGMGWPMMADNGSGNGDPLAALSSWLSGSVPASADPMGSLMRWINGAPAGSSNPLPGGTSSAAVETGRPDEVYAQLATLLRQLQAAQGQLPAGVSAPAGIPPSLSGLSAEDLAALKSLLETIIRRTETATAPPVGSTYVPPWSSVGPSNLPPGPPVVTGSTADRAAALTRGVDSEARQINKDAVLYHLGQRNKDKVREILAAMPAQERELLMQDLANPEMVSQGKHYEYFLDRLKGQFGEDAHEIWLTTALKDLKTRSNVPVASDKIQQYYLKQESISPQAFQAIQTYLNSLPPAEQDAWKDVKLQLNYLKDAPKHKANAARLQQALANKDVNAINALLDQLSPEDRQGLMIAVTSPNGQINTPAEARGAFLRELFAKLGEDAHDVWLNHALKGLKDESGADLQQHNLDNYYTKPENATVGTLRALGNFVQALPGADNRKESLSARLRDLQGGFAQQQATKVQTLLTDSTKQPAQKAQELRSILAGMSTEQLNAMIERFAQIAGVRKPDETPDRVGAHQVFWNRLREQLGDAAKSTAINEIGANNPQLAVFPLLDILYHPWNAAMQENGNDEGRAQAAFPGKISAGDKQVLKAMLQRLGINNQNDLNRPLEQQTPGFQALAQLLLGHGREHNGVRKTFLDYLKMAKIFD